MTQKIRTRFAPSPTGFIHLGTPRIDVPERERPDPAALLRDWTGA